MPCYPKTRDNMAQVVAYFIRTALTSHAVRGKQAHKRWAWSYAAFAALPNIGPIMVSRSSL